MVRDMLVCEQTQGQSVYEHGLSVKEQTFNVIDYIRGGPNNLDGWKIPKWLDAHKQMLVDNIWDDEIIALYTLYHDAGKPYCRTEGTDGRIHFPDHAEVSKDVWLHVMDYAAHCQVVGRLIGDDMFIHTASAVEVDERLRSGWLMQDALTSLVVALAEIHSNAKLFGGIQSISFKAKFKKVEKRGNQICKFFEEKNK